jgi:hypothetical protein
MNTETIKSVEELRKLPHLKDILHDTKEIEPYRNKLIRQIESEMQDREYVQARNKFISRAEFMTDAICGKQCVENQTVWGSTFLRNMDILVTVHK